jgi:hypothetical protein
VKERDCWLCKTEGESVDHLLLHCAAASGLWNAFFARFGFCWVMSHSVMELFVSWWTGGCLRSIVVWKIDAARLSGLQRRTINMQRIDNSRS